MKKNNLLLHPLGIEAFKKFLKMLRIQLFFITILISQANASVFSQPQPKVDLTLTNVTLRDAFDEITQQSGYLFFYSNEDLDDSEYVTADLKDVTLTEAVKEILQGQQCTFSLMDDYIIIRKSKKIPPSTPQKQEDEGKKITGKVMSYEDGKPIPGVNVFIKGTAIGAATDIDGEFSLEVPEDAEILVFSIVGMEKKEIKIGDKTHFEVTLKPSQIGLDEVLVVGYGTEIRRDLTGSISKVEIDEESSFGEASFEKYMQGRTSGVLVKQASGKLGEAITMRIRGSSSLSASNQPLYVVDGMPITSSSQSSIGNAPTSPLTDINFDDIKSIEVLKDAAATAIYGSRASNGVVLITTKEGTKGDATYNLKYESGVNQPSQMRDFMNANQYMTIINQSLESAKDPETGLIMGQTTEQLKDLYIPGWREGYNEDWQGQAFRDAGMMQKVNFSSRGGTQKTQFYTGITYEDQEGIIIGNNLNKISGRLNLTHEATKRLKFGAKMNYVRTNLDRVVEDNAWANPMQLSAIPPVQPITDPETGRYNTNTVYYNALITHRDASLTQKVDRVFINAFANYNFGGGFSFRSEYGADLLNQREKNYFGRETNWGQPAGEAFTRYNSVNNHNTNNYFSYDSTFNEKHKLSAVAGMSFQKTNIIGNSIRGQGFPTDDFENMSNAAEITAYSGNEYANSYLSYFSRVNYKYKDRYLLNLSGRIDGSSRFGEDSRYGFFPAGSVGWILSEENFMKDIEDISFLKLRTSYGVTGNSSIGNYEALGLFTGVNYAGITGLLPQQLASPNLKWETTTQLDVGIDIEFLDERFNLQMDYYEKHTKDLLLFRSLPANSGFLSITKNIGEMENKGFEFALTSHILKKKFKWTNKFNISHNTNKVVSIDGPEISYGQNYAIEGEEIGVFKMVEYAGVHPLTGDALFYLNDGSGLTTTNYNEAEKVIAGTPSPDFIGGMTNEFSYKNFDASFTLNFVYGNDVYMSGGRYLSANAEWWDNQTTDQLDRWQHPGDVTDVPEPRFGSANGSQHSTRYLYDGSYLRMKDLTIGYNLPSEWIKKMNIQKLRLYISGQNLFTLTNYPGYDPEVNSLYTGASTQANNIQSGVDYFTAPQIKQYMFGINVSL
ncbi:MAG: TonB-dependent receptor [Bacteroidota bacterium]